MDMRIKCFVEHRLLYPYDSLKQFEKVLQYLEIGTLDCPYARKVKPMLTILC